MEKIESMPHYTVEPVSHMTDDIWEQIANMEKATFGWSLTEEDMQDTKAAAEHPAGVTVLVRGIDQNILGYIIGYPGSAAYTDISEEDGEMIDDNSTIYIMTLVLDPSVRSRNAETLKKLFQSFMEEARKKRFQTVSAHSPVSHMAAYQKFLGAESQHTIEDWCGSGESHIYWTASVN